jgi:hypothetical protein
LNPNPKPLVKVLGRIQNIPIPHGIRHEKNIEVRENNVFLRVF